MSHAIRTKKTENNSSYWVQPETSKRYSASSLPIETNDISELVDALLAEFKMTNADLIPGMKEDLKNWLESMKSTELNEIDASKVRDFIYEMF